MNVLGIFRPKWQHPNAKVRAAAIATLTDQEVLADVVENDSSETVRLAALQRITSQSALARIARSNSPFNDRAFGNITDGREIVSVARSAEAPRLRSLAVDKIDDALVLNQIATLDADASVRRDALSRRFRLGADPMREFLAGLLSELPVAENRADREAGFRGNLDEVCGVLACDRRFRLNGVLIDRSEEPSAAPIDSTSSASVHAGAADSPPARRGSVEFVAARCGCGGEADQNSRGTLHYRIKIWRMGAETFDASVEQRRSETRHNVAVWSASSAGSDEQFSAGVTSVRVG